MWETSSAFVHPSDVYVACGEVPGHLDVANEAAGDLSLVPPSQTVVSGVANEDVLAASEIVPGNVHPSVGWRGEVVISPGRHAIGAGAAVNTVLSPAIWIPGRGGLVPAYPSAASAEAGNEPGLAWLVVQDDGATTIGEGALAVKGKPVEGVAAIDGD